VLKVVPPSSADAIKARGVVERQTKHMTSLVSDLLDINRVTLGKLSLQRERFNAAEALFAVIDVWRATGRLESHMVSPSLEPVWVEGDRVRIEQIASNLLDNAIKFTPAGKKITVSLRREDREAVLRVADEGIGVAPEECSRIFELFVQGNFSPRAGGGLGIGLALVKRLAELHGGSASAASEGQGRGMTFTVRLPAVDQPTVQAKTPSVDVASRRSILIVEDNDDARQMLQAILSLDGHQVCAARDGKSGLGLAAETCPDLALIDIALPDMDGYEVARRLRTLNGDRRIDLIAISAFGQAHDQRRAYEVGFDAYLVKPVVPERLKQVIAGLR
jgi:CheY-like chemotaxis protein